MRWLSIVIVVIVAIVAIVAIVVTVVIVVTAIAIATATAIAIALAIVDLKVTLLDHLTGNYREERLFQLEKDWIIRLETFGPTGLNSGNQLQ